MNHPSKIQFKSIDEFLIIAPPDITKANLGHGSYGVVKLAKHHKQNNKYALKIVKFDIISLLSIFFFRLIVKNFMAQMSWISLKEK